MQLIHTISELREALSQYRHPAVVPTMGNLHAGHLALVRQAKPLGDVTISTIFVNRLQFAPHEDFDTYPRTLEADCQHLEAAGCDIVFAPKESELYPQAQTFKVHPPTELADILEGHFRPGFFIGVCTVVMKLLAVTQARTALFGKKDYQQLMVIRNMVKQFALPIDVVGGETQRNEAGLALSSRNGYLTPAQREEALLVVWHLARHRERGALRRNRPPATGKRRHASAARRRLDARLRGSAPPVRLAGPTGRRCQSGASSRPLG